MNFVKNNKILFLLFLIALIISGVFLLNYFISKQIQKQYFYSQDTVYSQDFLKPYLVKTFNYKKENINVYSILNPISKNTILYFVSPEGILPDILNSQILENNVFILSYPKLKENANFADLTNILALTIKYIQSLSIQTTDVILFGQKITANVILSYSQDQSFKALMLMNLLSSESTLCTNLLNSFFCKLIKPSFKTNTKNNNPIYFFFNDVNSSNIEAKYSLFNEILAEEKFLFELPGTNLNYNFNHIMQFYNNTLFHQSLSHEDEPGYHDYSGDVIDADGFLNPEEYID
jgi:hypothetical protein